MTDLVPLADQIEKAKLLAASSILPPSFQKQPSNLLWAMEMAAALDVSLAQAITGLTVINGRPTMSAEMMRALVIRAGHRFVVTTMTDAEATVTVARREWPDDAQQFTFTMADATKAGLAQSQTYKKHPKAMLLARATSMACRAVFPDVVAGMGYTPDEISPAQPARATVVDTTRLHPTQPQPPEQVDTDTGEILDADLVDDPEPQTDIEDGDLISDPQMRLLQLLLKRAAIDRDDAHAYAEEVIGHPVASAKDLTRAEASQVIDHLQTAIGEAQ